MGKPVGVHFFYTAAQGHPGQAGAIGKAAFRQGGHAVLHRHLPYLCTKQCPGRHIGSKIRHRSAAADRKRRCVQIILPSSFRTAGAAVHRVKGIAVPQ